MLDSVSPIDGRYRSKTSDLSPYFSEKALIRYRILVEVEYLIFLSSLGIISLPDEEIDALRSLLKSFDDNAAQRVKEIEKTTNHDVKAVEYFLKEALKGKLADGHLEYVHFALTSQDVNHTALPLMIKDSNQRVIVPALEKLVSQLDDLSSGLKDDVMLARTHGQPASPTTLGKELKVFVSRLEVQLNTLRSVPFKAKFGGATGHFNAHKVAFPNVNWPREADRFIESMGLLRHQTTTQITHYDDLSEWFHVLSRITTILIDLCRDIWTYISINYFTQKIIEHEVGSSTMPHKVNPIDFENAEGNLGLSRALFNYLADTLPISRLQRDLTDSTVSRNIGVPCAHLLIACKSIIKGLGKLQINRSALEKDLRQNWSIISEGIQTVLRREGVSKPYELLKNFARGSHELSQEDFSRFIDQLEVTEDVKKELLAITPFNYIGYSNT